MARRFCVVLGFAILVFEFAFTSALGATIFDDDWKPPAPAKQTTSTSTTAPAGGSAEPGKTATFRHVVPTPAEQAPLRKTMRELFAKELANPSPSARRALATELIQQATEMKDAPIDRFVLLVGALEAARDGSDLTVACQAADEMEIGYLVDGLRVKTEAALKMNLRADLLNVTQENCESGLDLVDDLITTEDYEDAARILQSVRTAAPHEQTHAEVQARFKKLIALRAAATAIAGDLEKLKTVPDDPMANQAVGEYYCFVMGQWDRGLPMLARGSDPDLRAVAQRELAPTTHRQARALADAWWDYAHRRGNSPEQQQGASERSAQWYRAALPDLSGPEATLVQKRIADVRSDPESASSVYLSELDALKVDRIVRDSVWDLSKNTIDKLGRPLSVNGVHYDHGLGYNPNLSGGRSRITYSIAGKYARFRGLVGINDTSHRFMSVLTVRILGDGRELWASEPIEHTRVTESFDVSVRHVKILELVVDCGGHAGDAHVAWLNPRLDPK